MELDGFVKAELRQIGKFFGTEFGPGNLDKETLVRTLEADGVTVDLVFENIPDLKAIYTVDTTGVNIEDFVEEPVTENTVVTNDFQSEEVEAVEEPVKIVTAEPFQPKVQEKYLIKMDRKNHYFETAGYVFTKDHPYALVDSADVNTFLRGEEGFSIASPDDLQEYYG